MNDTFEQTLLALAESLLSLDAHNAEPPQALEKMRELRAKYPGADLDLVWDRDPYEKRAHFDALLGFEKRGTFSVSFCPDRAIPWPLRGAQRWSEYELLRVNQTLLRVDEAIELIDFVWNEEPLMRNLINTCLIWETLAKDPIAVSDEELQRAMDEFRGARGLNTAEKTAAWLSDNGLDQTRLEHHLEAEVARAKLRARVAAHRIEDYFATKKAELASVKVAELSVSNERRAEVMKTALTSRSADFVELCSTADSGRIFSALRSELPAAVFAAKKGDVVGPVQVGSSFRVYRVLDAQEAKLDDETRALIERTLFDEWLENRRQKARIEWNWGRSAEDEGDEDRPRPYR